MEIYHPWMILESWYLDITSISLVQLRLLDSNVQFWTPHGCVHNILNHIQLIYSFQKGKDLKLEIEMACNHCAKFMVWSHNIWFLQYIFKIKIIYFWILQLIFIFIQNLLGKKLQILNFIIYLYINSIDDSKPCKI
jgi:hypothetical protein